MSSGNDDANPYAEFGSSASVARPNPTGMNVSLVFVLILAILGAIGALMGVAQTIGGQWMQQMIIDSAEANPENKQMQAQAEIQRMTQSVTKKYTVSTIATLIPVGILCIPMAIGAVMTMKRSPRWRSILLMVLLAVVVLDVFKAANIYIQQSAMGAVMQDEKFGNVITSDPNLPEEQAEAIKGTVSNVMGAFQIGMTIFMIVWLLLKIGLYLFTYFYLKRPEIGALFSTPDDSEPLVATAVSS